MPPLPINRLEQLYVFLLCLINAVNINIYEQYGYEQPGCVSHTITVMVFLVGTLTSQEPLGLQQPPKISHKMQQCKSFALAVACTPPEPRHLYVTKTLSLYILGLAFDTF